VLSLSGLGFGSLVFASPWILSALLLVPLAYLIIRAIPPAPRRMFFPATWLTRALNSENLTSQSAPWWLILLRLLMLIVLILALAGPFLTKDTPLTADGPLALIIDNDWASAADWDQRKALAQEKLKRLTADGRKVAIIPTAAPMGGWPSQGPQFVDAAQASQHLASLAPMAWPPDYNAAANHLLALSDRESSAVIYITSGIDHGGARGLLEVMENAQSIDIVGLKRANLAQVAIASVKSTARGFDLLLIRKDAQPALNLTAAISDVTGTLLARKTGQFESGATKLDLSIDILPQLRGRATKLYLEGIRHAAATHIFDARAQRPLVGLVTQSGNALVQPLQTPDYYLSRALQPFANIERGDMTSLLKQSPSVMLLPDQARAAPDVENSMLDWVGRGGLLIRFSGPKMFVEDTVREDALLPTTLRLQPRVVGGALSWSTAQPIAEFSQDSPFFGINIAPEIAVERQALMRAGVVQQAQIWAQLQDGTPLVSARSLGNGTLVLFHTSANAAWSNLALSGTFVEMLQRLLELSLPSHGADRSMTDSMMLTRSLNAKGSLTTPTAQLPPVAKSDLRRRAAGPTQPPGIYEGERSLVALNLAAAAGPITPRTAFRAMEETAGVLPYRLVDGPQERSLREALFILLFVLAFVDMLATLLIHSNQGLRLPKMPRFLRRAAAGAGVLLGAMALDPYSAAAQVETPADLAANVRLACLETGQAQVDALCLNGLNSLSRQLNMRTSVLTGSAQLILPGRDDLGLFPLIYWPVAEGRETLSKRGYQALESYLSNGGMMLLDLGINQPGQAGFDINQPTPEALLDIRRNMSLPPLANLTKEHVLTHSFYILKSYPGRRGRATVWLEAGGEDIGASVSPIIIGNADWISAWASARTTLPGYAKGDARDSELAIRFGINIVMYALTGTYKADQVHLPALLDRVGRGE